MRYLTIALLFLAGCSQQLPYSCVTFSSTMSVNEPMAVEKTVTSMTCTPFEKVDESPIK
jgi:hypothetical protein